MVEEELDHVILCILKVPLLEILSGPRLVAVSSRVARFSRYWSYYSLCITQLPRLLHSSIRFRFSPMVGRVQFFQYVFAVAKTEAIRL